ncbi:hypothetical protein HDU92_006552 [Lobulomyces angularis]|nr:hypothetical protein HDU92_006552 [Lobulomyces angularis]
MATHFNTFEAKICVQFLKYLLKQGYKSDDKRSECHNPEEEEDFTVENFNLAFKIVNYRFFSGEEATFVIFSLVRSNGIGFLRASSRINVMLSRAKHGMAIIGNKNVLLDSNSTE